MAVAAGLDWNPCGGLMPKILSHYGGGTTQEGEGICQHAFVPDGY
jgi:hypothetical protein